MLEPKMNGQPLIEGQEFNASKPFSDMAALVEHNAKNSFGGACVIVPPPGAGSNVELLMLDPKVDPAQFWSTLKTKIELVLVEMDEKRRLQQMHGMR